MLLRAVFYCASIGAKIPDFLQAGRVFSGG
jgi:hypothetical protein